MIGNYQRFKEDSHSFKTVRGLAHCNKHYVPGFAVKPEIPPFLKELDPAILLTGIFTAFNESCDVDVLGVDKGVEVQLSGL